MDCVNTECDGYDENCVDNCSASDMYKAEECCDYKPLKAQTEPVAEVPCSAGLSVELLKERCEGLETIQTCFEDAAKNVITGWESDDKQMFIRGIKGLQILMGNR
jgi:hypothetical protein